LNFFRAQIDGIISPVMQGTLHAFSVQMNGG